MKKVGLILGFVLMLSIFGFAIVSAEDNNSASDSGDGVLTNVHDGANNTAKEMRDNRERINEMKDRIEELKDKIKERRGEFRVEGKNMNVSELSDNQKEFIVGKTYAKTGMNISIEDLNGTVGGIMSAYMSNGKKAEIRVMPDVASEKAKEKMRVRCEERNCTFELKEVGQGNDTRAVYEVKATKESKLFGVFNKKMEVRTEIDAQTGNASVVMKPWWAFLAKEQDDNVNATVIGNSTN